MADSSGYYYLGSDMESLDHERRGSSNETELQREKQKNSVLRAQVEEYKAQLIELASEEEEVPDTTIQTRYEHLCKEIEKWVDDVIHEEDRPFDEVWNRVKTGPEGAKLAEMVSSVLIDFDGHAAIGIGILPWLNEQRYLNCFILSLVIWRLLETCVFDEPFPIGTSTDRHGNLEQLLLQDILNCMKEKSQGGVTNALRWRSETLTTMTLTTSFEDRQQIEASRLFSKLSKELEIWVNPSKSVVERLHNDILLTAIILHQDMKCSRREYHLIRPEPHSPTGRETLERKLKRWSLIKMATWRDEIARGDTVPLICLSPGLHRINSGEADAKDLTLTKPVVVVYNSGEEEGQYTEVPKSRRPSVSNKTKQLQKCDRISSASSSTSLDSKGSKDKLPRKVLSRVKSVFSSSPSQQSPERPSGRSRRSSRSTQKGLEQEYYGNSQEQSRPTQSRRASRISYPQSPTKDRAHSPSYFSAKSPSKRRSISSDAAHSGGEDGDYDASYENDRTPRQSEAHVAKAPQPLSRDSFSYTWPQPAIQRSVSNRADTGWYGEDGVMWAQYEEPSISKYPGEG